MIIVLFSFKNLIKKVKKPKINILIELLLLYEKKKLLFIKY